MMDNGSCIARRTRLQRDLHFRSMFCKGKGVQGDGLKLEQSGGEGRKRCCGTKRRRVGGSPDVVYIGEADQKSESDFEAIEIEDSSEETESDFNAVSASDDDERDEKCDDFKEENGVDEKGKNVDVRGARSGGGWVNEFEEKRSFGNGGREPDHVPVVAECSGSEGVICLGSDDENGNLFGKETRQSCQSDNGCGGRLDDLQEAPSKMGLEKEAEQAWEIDSDELSSSTSEDDDSDDEDYRVDDMEEVSSADGDDDENSNFMETASLLSSDTDREEEGEEEEKSSCSSIKEAFSGVERRKELGKEEREEYRASNESICRGKTAELSFSGKSNNLGSSSFPSAKQQKEKGVEKTKDEFTGMDTNKTNDVRSTFTEKKVFDRMNQQNFDAYTKPCEEGREKNKAKAFWSALAEKKAFDRMNQQNFDAYSKPCEERREKNKTKAFWSALTEKTAFDGMNQQNCVACSKQSEETKEHNIEKKDEKGEEEKEGGEVKRLEKNVDTSDDGSKKGKSIENKDGGSEMKYSGKRKRDGLMKNMNLFKLLSNSIWEKDEGIKDDLCPPQDEHSHQQSNKSVVDDPLPLKFTVGIEEPEPVEKTEFEKELDFLWEEMEFVQQSCQIGSFESQGVDDNRMKPSTTEIDQSTLCCQGKHQFVLDEEIGIKCSVCSFIQVEIKHVYIPLEKCPPGFSAKKYVSRKEYMPKFDGLQCEGSGSNSENFSNGTEGTVWDTIPGTKEDLYPHQREGFEFIWKNFEGTIDLDKLKSSDFNGGEGGGCIISHAPGTGKTRLTIVFLQAYLELFPDCRPVIMAPASLLLTWEAELTRWGSGIPFHNLNSLELSGKEDGTVLNIMEGAKVQSRSHNTIRMVKLFSWSKNGRSILGVSYSLFEKLAGEKSDKETATMRKILLELPGLCVLDEGHTPRNQRSGIWKVLSKLQTEKRIILSGTPFQNNFLELYNTLCLVRPGFEDMLPSRLKKFCQTRPRSRKRVGIEKWDSIHSKVDNLSDDGIEKLKALMAPFVHVHKGSILQQHLPGLRDCVVVLKPPDLQRCLLENIEPSQNTFEFEHKLAMVSIHPSLILCCSLSQKEEPVIDPDLLEQLRLDPYAGVKTKFLIEFIQLSVAINEKVLIFSQFIDPLRLIIKQLQLKLNWSEGKEMLHMYGKVDVNRRQHLINTFNNPNKGAKVLLASTKACSEGISLVGASRVVLLDVVWNPSVERQAISRAYRLGQKNVVYTYHLMIQGTSECEKYCKQAEKDRISKLVFSSTNKKDGEEKVAAGISEDKILDEMVCHDKLKDIFDKIIYQPKESDLIESFGSVAL